MPASSRDSEADLPRSYPCVHILILDVHKDEGQNPNPKSYAREGFE